MENVTKTTLLDKPYYFGIYLNMVRLNFFQISNHLANKPEKYGLKKATQLSNEDKWQSSFIFHNGENYSLVNHLKRYLPILKVLDYKIEDGILIESQNTTDTLKEGISNLKEIVKILSDARNYNSHAIKIIEKENHLVVNENVKKFILEAFEICKLLTKKKLTETETSNYAQEAFDIFETKNEFYQLINNDNKLTNTGLIFLICCFLDKENGFYFLSQLYGFKGTHDPKFRAVREVFMNFSCKLPHDKFISDDPIQSMILDMQNELCKCPKELYNVITPEAKQKFLPTLGEHEKLNVNENSIPDEELNYEEYLESIIKRTRNQNRFYGFALRYFDHYSVIGKYKFHIHLGKIPLKEYDKTIAKETIYRTIEKPLKGFGKLEDFKQSESDDQLKYRSEYNVKYNIKYNIVNNKIGIKLITDKNTKSRIKDLDNNSKIVENVSIERNKSNVPDAFLSIYELEKIILLDFLGGNPEHIIKSFIGNSNNSLMSLLSDEDKKELAFKPLVRLSNKQSQKTKDKKQEDFYKKYVAEVQSRKNKLQAILTKYGKRIQEFKDSEIDEAIHLITNSKNQFSLKEKIKKEIRDCKKRRNDIELKKQPKIGTIASFITQDLVNMVKGKEVKKKITTSYVNQIQQCIALYADTEKKKHVIAIFKELNLYSSIDGHPFLQQVSIENMSNTNDLYIEYLIQKEKWLESFKKVVNKKTVFHFQNEHLPYKWKFEKGVEENTHKPKIPVNIPTSIFDAELVRLLKAKLDENSISHNANKTNYSQLLRTWWNSNDGVQDFYTSEREYNSFDETICFRPNTESSFKKYLSTESINNIMNRESEKRITNSKYKIKSEKEIRKIIYSKIAEREKEIRKVQEQDMMMTMMLQKLMSQINLKLQNIGEILDENIKDPETISVKKHFDEHGNYDANGIEIERKIVEVRKRKNMSVLKRFSHDRKLGGLFTFFNDNDFIDSGVITRELQEYRKLRIEIAGTIFDLEDLLFLKFKDEVAYKYDALKKTHSEIEFDVYENVLNEKYPNDTDLVAFIKKIRNIVFHNQYPEKVLVDEYGIVNPYSNDEFSAEKLYEVTSITTQIQEIWNKKLNEFKEKIGSKLDL